MTLPDYYEFLQISPNAEPDTIHRVYRFLALRYHPDNPETCDPDKFYLLQQAYEVLSDKTRRAEYDVARGIEGGTSITPLSSSVDFMDNNSGELNRRLAVLALLYLKRRSSPDKPTVSLFEIEDRMGFPREYLDFTLWYLQRKGYITRADNAEIALLVDGVDFVETERHGFPILNRLLTSSTAGPYPEGSPDLPEPRPSAGPIVVPVPNGASKEVGAGAKTGHFGK
jgi:curved DNA-binding protein